MATMLLGGGANAPRGNTLPRIRGAQPRPREALAPPPRGMLAAGSSGLWRIAAHYSPEEQGMVPPAPTPVPQPTGPRVVAWSEHPHGGSRVALQRCAVA